MNDESRHKLSYSDVVDRASNPRLALADQKLDWMAGEMEKLALRDYGLKIQVSWIIVK